MTINFSTHFSQFDLIPWWMFSLEVNPPTAKSWQSLSSLLPGLVVPLLPGGQEEVALAPHLQVVQILGVPPGGKQSREALGLGQLLLRLNQHPHVRTGEVLFSHSVASSTIWLGPKSFSWEQSTVEINWTGAEFPHWFSLSEAEVWSQLKSDDVKYFSQHRIVDMSR